MSDDKIGTDVFGGHGSSMLSSLSPKKRRELEKKIKEEMAKKNKADGDRDEEEKLPKLPIPEDKPHEKVQGKFGWDEVNKELKKNKRVHVDEHYRKKPIKRNLNAEDIF